MSLTGRAQKGTSVPRVITAVVARDTLVVLRRQSVLTCARR